MKGQTSPLVPSGRALFRPTAAAAVAAPVTLMVMIMIPSQNMMRLLIVNHVPSISCAAHRVTVQLLSLSLSLSLGHNMILCAIQSLLISLDPWKWKWDYNFSSRIFFWRNTQILDDKKLRLFCASLLVFSSRSRHTAFKRSYDKGGKMKSEHPLELAWITFVYTRELGLLLAPIRTTESAVCLFCLNATQQHHSICWCVQVHSTCMIFWCKILLASNASKVSYSISSSSLISITISLPFFSSLLFFLFFFSFPFFSIFCIFIFLAFFL